MSTTIRLLTKFEEKRLEAVIENEARCHQNGVRFCEYDIEQEGRYILGLGQYRASYAAGTV
jgi:intergrase/recombinase